MHLKNIQDKIRCVLFQQKQSSVKVRIFVTQLFLLTYANKHFCAWIVFSFFPERRSPCTLAIFVISHAYTNSWQHFGHEKLPWHFVMFIFQFIRRKYYNFIFNFNRLNHLTVTSVSSTGCLKCLRKENSWIPLLNRVVMRCILPLGVWCACSPRQKSR